MNLKKDISLVDGDIKKSILYFAIPLMLGSLFQQLYNTVDSIVVGNFIGDNALAAVNSSASIINLLISFFMGCALGAGVCISQYFGAKKDKEVHDVVHTTMALSIVASIIVTIIGVICTPFILQMVNVAPEVMANSQTYLTIYFGGITSVIVYNMASAILRSVGDSKSPLYYLMVASIINIILDLLFVIVFDMKIAGVGYATLIAQFTSAMLVIIKLIRCKEVYRLEPKKIRFHKHALHKIIKIGLPSAIQNTIISLSNVVSQANINTYGAVAMAGAGSYMRIEGFAAMPIFSFSMALTTFVGQNMGAKKYERVKKGATIGLIMSCISTLVISILLFLFADEMISIFSSNQEVIKVGKLMMQTVLPGYLLLTVSHTLAGILKGAGLTKIPMYVMILCWCICRMLWVTFASNTLHDIVYVFMGWPLTWLLSTIILVTYYRKNDWISYNI